MPITDEQCTAEDNIVTAEVDGVEYGATLPDETGYVALFVAGEERVSARFFHETATHTMPSGATVIGARWGLVDLSDFLVNDGALEVERRVLGVLADKIRRQLAN